MPKPPLVEAVAGDLGDYRTRNEIVNRQAVAHAGANLSRGDRMRRDREEDDSLWSIERGQDRLQLLAVVAGSARDSQRRQLQDRFGLAPAQEAGELIGADEKGQVVAALA